MQPGLAREVRLVMGTAAEVQVEGPVRPQAALDAAFAALGRVDDAMSLWKPSELRRLNASGAAEVSLDLFTVVQASLEAARRSGGAFDPTVGSDHVGHARVHLDRERRRIALEPGTRLDLNGIAKGYAVDLALRELRDQGAQRGLVDLGQSSLGAFGSPLPVAVRDPEGSPEPWATFRLPEGWALSSSGGDQRPGHIVDPRNGRPARLVLAATVLAPTAMEADALSTAVFVLGPRAGLELLAKEGLSGFVLSRTEKGRVLEATAGFAARHGLQAAPGVTIVEIGQWVH